MGETRQRFAFAGATLLWGTTFLAISVGNASVPPLWSATIRLVLAAILLALLAAITRSAWPRGGALLGAALFGFFNFGINFSLLYWGELTVPSGVAAVFFATIPLTVAFLAAALGVERLSFRRVAGGVVAFTGVALVFAGELATNAPLVSLVAVFLGATSAAVSGVVLKRAPRADLLPTNAVGAAVGALVTLAGSFLLGEPRAVPSTFEAWWPIAYLTLAGSLGAFLLWTWLVRNWRVTSASMVSVVVPVVALALGAAVNGERLSPTAVAGAALVMIGVYVVLKSTDAGAKGFAPAARSPRHDP